MLSNQLPSSHPLTAPVHLPERVTGPPELHHSEGRYLMENSLVDAEHHCPGVVHGAKVIVNDPIGEWVS